MSIQNLALQQLSLNPSPISLPKETTHSRKVRNRQYVPSDEEYDEDDDDDEDDSDAEHEDHVTANKKLNTTFTTSYCPSPSSSTASLVKPLVRKVTPLPSDDEDDDEDEDSGTDSEDDDKEDIIKLGLGSMKKRLYRLQGVQSSSQLDNYMAPTKPSFLQPKTRGGHDGQRHSAGDSKTATAYDSGDERAIPHTLLSKAQKDQFQQWQYMQQYQQAQMLQFQYQQQQQYQQQRQQQLQYFHPHPHPHHQMQQQPYPIKSHSSSSHLRHQYQQQGQLSGMELLAQREQDKAEAKRQKPKLNPSHAKIEGLLAKLPEPGSHNISFQNVYQQHRYRQQVRSPSPAPLAFPARQPPRSLSAMSMGRR